MSTTNSATPLLASSASAGLKGTYSAYCTQATSLAVASGVLYALNGELLQFLQVSVGGNGVTHASPLVNLLLCHLGGLLLLPYFMKNPPQWNLPAWHVPTAALGLGLLLMGYNYAWLHSATFLPVGLTNALFQSGIAGTYVVFLLLGEETFSMQRCVGVMLTILGVCLAGEVFAGQAVPGNQRLGIMFALLAAGGLTLYQVTFRGLYGHLKSDARFLAYVYMWIGIVHVVVVLPLILFAGFLGVEKLTVPNTVGVALGTLLTALIASAVNGAMLCVMAWGAPLLLPASQALSIPIAVVFDLLFHHTSLTRAQLLGELLIIVAFAVLTDVSLITKFVPAFKQHKFADELSRV